MLPNIIVVSVRLQSTCSQKFEKVICRMECVLLRLVTLNKIFSNDFITELATYSTVETVSDPVHSSIWGVIWFAQIAS
jgi:hypothetical protein